MSAALVLIALLALFIVARKPLRRHWRRQQRRIDMRILWPSCVECADNLREAKFAFAIHMATDHAWRTDFDDEQLARFVTGLTAESSEAP